MKLKGSCHCQAVGFEVESTTPTPYQRCYCSVCRKTQGGGGYAINLGAAFNSMKVKGRENISIYHARIDGEDSVAERHFCKLCGSHLWLYDHRWPELVHPHASSIDTPLPSVTNTTHIMLEFKANWVAVEHHSSDRLHSRYPEESILEWHRRTGREVT
jgi:hypothetical protein